jgi:hypothetical protein
MWIQRNELAYKGLVVVGLTTNHNKFVKVATR